MLQPISAPGQPSGHQGPTRPTQRPLAFSITENIANPSICQQPTIAARLRYAIERACVPPM